MSKAKELIEAISSEDDILKILDRMGSDASKMMQTLSMSGGFARDNKSNKLGKAWLDASKAIDNYIKEIKAAVDISKKAFKG